eukprot:TRINITY_DN2202_c0_g1_i1.p1 TRINITY_DN2202_c0_g1~~TRINITY_DN2202_c0_g1_i1.p1  ORF type:complete len:311 (+),score=143.82 TRINITY_DN2202_c0_g1_i1:75-1007(+)
MASLISKGLLSNGFASKSAIVNGVPQAKFGPSGQVANAGNLKEVKNRIKSVTSIKKITKTMNMIATARLRAAQNRMETARSFYDTIGRAFETVPETAAKKALFIPITSDRGLCGAVNTQVVKFTKNKIKEQEEKGATVNIVPIGEKGPSQLARESSEKILWQAGDTSRKSLNFLAISMITDRILQTEFDVAHVLYNKFNTVISYTTSERVIPSYNTLVSKLDAFDQFEFEDDNNLFHLQDLFEYYLASTLFSSFADAAAAELGGRMSSMDNATRNAGDMIKRLTIEYNRKRQAAITTELNEIISGASAIQ